MPRGPITNQIQQPTNPSRFQRSVSKIPPQQTEPIPYNTRTRINTLRTIQHTKHRTSMRQSPNKSSPQLQEIALGEMRSLNTMQSSRNIHGAENTKLSPIIQRQSRYQPDNPKDSKDPRNKSTTPGPISRVQMTTEIRTSSLTDQCSPMIRNHPVLHISPNNCRRTHKNTLRGSRLLPNQPDIRRGELSCPKQLR